MKTGNNVRNMIAGNMAMNGISNTAQVVIVRYVMITLGVSKCIASGAKAQITEHEIINHIYN